MTDSKDVFVLTRTRMTDDAATVAVVVGVYASRSDADDRVARMAARNAQYPLRPFGDSAWILGPDEDEGFFGNRPMLIRVIPAKLYEATR